MEIDIRHNTVEVVDAIRVASPCHDSTALDIIWWDGGAVHLADSDARRILARVDNKEHAENIIRGLQKAIEFGWLNY